MAYDWTIREGSTQPVVFLLQDGDDVYSLAGILALEIRLVPRTQGTTLIFTTADPELAVTDPTAGEVTFYPGTTTLSFTHRAYDVYFWVTDGEGYKISFPSNHAFPIQMIDAP